ncbi:hypothetical protein LINGRAHAP2_LOCUS27932 [Linum grandiflorum]
MKIRIDILIESKLAVARLVVLNVVRQVTNKWNVHYGKRRKHFMLFGMLVATKVNNQRMNVDLWL